MDAVTTSLARGAILRSLKVWLDRQPAPGESATDPFMSEDLLQAHLARFLRLALPIGAIRGLLSYMVDAHLVEANEVLIGGETYYAWRITHDGIELLEGNRKDTGVAP